MRGWDLGEKKLLSQERNLILNDKMWDGHCYGNQVFYTLQAPHECNPWPLHSQALNGHKQYIIIIKTVINMVSINKLFLMENYKHTPCVGDKMTTTQQKHQELSKTVVSQEPHVERGRKV